MAIVSSSPGRAVKKNSRGHVAANAASLKRRASLYETEPLTTSELAVQLVHVVTVVTRESVEYDPLVLEARVTADLCSVTFGAAVALPFLICQRVADDVYLMTAHAGHIIKIVQAARPLHALEVTHVVCVAIDAGLRLLLYRVVRTENYERRHSLTAARTRHMQAAGTMTGLTTLVRVWRVRVIRVAVRGFRHQVHAFAGMTTHAALGTFRGVLRFWYTAAAAALRHPQVRCQADKD